MSKYDVDPDAVGEDFAEQTLRLIELHEDIREAARPHVFNLRSAIINSQAGTIRPQQTLGEFLSGSKKISFKSKEGPIRHNAEVEFSDRKPVVQLKKAHLHFQEADVQDRIWGAEVQVDFDKKSQPKTIQLSWAHSSEDLLKNLHPTVGTFIEAHCEGGYLHKKSDHTTIELAFGELPSVVIRQHKPRTIYGGEDLDFTSQFIFDPKTNQFVREPFVNAREKDHYVWAYKENATNPISVEEYLGLVDTSLGLFPRAE